jgi:hypothetical protein
MTWFSRPNKNGDVFEKISETEPTVPARKVRISTPFHKIQSPLFHKTEEQEDVEISEDEVNLPKVIRNADFDLFSKEAQLTGWEVKKISRHKVEVEVGGKKGHYVRRGKRWRLEKVTKSQRKLSPYDTPLTKLIERDFQEAMDSEIMDYVYKAAAKKEDEDL